MKLDAEEKDLLESVEKGESKPSAGGRRERAKYSRYAKATFRKDRRLNIRLSSKDLEAIQKAGARRGVAVPDADLEPAAQVRRRPTQRGCQRPH
jgi:predicted DNA binding CopG/RHH family protein